MARYSKTAQRVIGAKMHKMKGEDKPQEQKVAIALEEARRKGLKVPSPQGKPSATLVPEAKRRRVLPHKMIAEKAKKRWA